VRFAWCCLVLLDFNMRLLSTMRMPILKLCHVTCYSVLMMLHVLRGSGLCQPRTLFAGLSAKA
jgi:hypothetical protein